MRHRSRLALAATIALTLGLFTSAAPAALRLAEPAKRIKPATPAATPRTSKPPKAAKPARTASTAKPAKPAKTAPADPWFVDPDQAFAAVGSASRFAECLALIDASNVRKLVGSDRWDQLVLQHRSRIEAAGTHEECVKIRREDWERLCNALVANIATD